MNLTHETDLGWLGAMATVAAALLVADSQLADAKGPQSTTEFTIDTNQTSGTWFDFGKFNASGAISDRGRARTFYDAELGSSVLELDGNHGDMRIALWSGAEGGTFFTILEGTGAYAEFGGISGSVTGYAEITRKGVIKIYQTLTGMRLDHRR